MDFNNIDLKTFIYSFFFIIFLGIVYKTKKLSLVKTFYHTIGFYIPYYFMLRNQKGILNQYCSRFSNWQWVSIEFENQNSQMLNM